MTARFPPCSIILREYFRRPEATDFSSTQVKGVWMVDLSGIHNTLLKWIKGQTGLVIVWRGITLTPVPTSAPYLFLRISRPNGEDRYVLSIHGFRGGARTALENLRLSLDRFTVQDELKHADIEYGEGENNYAPLFTFEVIPIQRFLGEKHWLLEIRFETRTESEGIHAVSDLPALEDLGSIITRHSTV